MSYVVFLTCGLLREGHDHAPTRSLDHAAPVFRAVPSLLGAAIIGEISILHLPRLVVAGSPCTK